MRCPYQGHLTEMEGDYSAFDVTSKASECEHYQNEMQKICQNTGLISISVQTFLKKAYLIN